MKKLLLLTKTLLAAVLLCVGQNAWALTETFGESKATDKNTYIIGTSVNIHMDSNPGGAGPLAVFNSKTDKGIKLRTIQSTTPLTLIVNPGYKVTNVTINAYQNNKTTGTITCDSYAVDGASPVAFGSPVSIPLNVENASTQTLGTISVDGIEATSSIAFNFTNTGAAQNQIYAYIEVTYEEVTDTKYSKNLAGWAADDATTTEGTIGKWYHSSGVTTGDNTGIQISATYGLGVCASRTTAPAVLKLNHSANSVVTIDAVWNIGAADNNANTPYNTFQYGGLVIKQVVDTRSWETLYSVNGGGYISLGKDKFDVANSDMTIHLKVNSYTGVISEFYIKNGETEVLTLSALSEANKTFSPGTNYNELKITAVAPATKGSQRTRNYMKSITISEQEQAVYGYTINGKTGSTILKEFATGTNLPGSTIYYHYNQFLNNNGTLYQAGKDDTGVDDKGYKSKFTLDTDNKVVEKTYSQPTTPITNVVFLAEGENIFTRTTGSSADTRCSMGAGGYAGSKTAFVTLPAGEYYLVMSNRCTGNRTGIHKFYKGSEETPFFSADGVGNNKESSSDAFTLTETTTLYFQGGDGNQYVDWLYIYGTPSNEIVGAVDYSTGYLDDMTNKVTLSPGESYNYKFINHNSGSSSQWLNYVVPVYTSADVKTLVIRSDNWEDVKGTNAGCTNNFVWGDANATFIEEMNGATVDMTISYNASNVLTMNAAIKTKSGYDWTYSYRTDYSGSGISLEGDIKVALSVSNSWLELAYEGTTGTVSKTITAAGWATYCSQYALDLEHATGLTNAYIVTGATGSVLNTTSVKGGTIPANTGILIEAPEGTVTIPVVARSSTNVEGNELVGVTVDTPIAADAGYVLMADPSLGFYKNANAFTVGANTAYLPADFASLARSAFFFGGNITAVDNVEAAEAKAKDGKFIENGKLVIVKNGQKFNAAGAQVK